LISAVFLSPDFSCGSRPGSHHSFAHEKSGLGECIRNAWRIWEYDWQVPTKPGKATLIARATDSEGRTQPKERDQDRRSYIVNHLLPVEVEVR
jgi:hypothetical protein